MPKNLRNYQLVDGPKEGDYDSSVIMELLATAYIMQMKNFKTEAFYDNKRMVHI